MRRNENCPDKPDNAGHDTAKNGDNPISKEWIIYAPFHKDIINVLIFSVINTKATVKTAIAPYDGQTIFIYYNTKIESFPRNAKSINLF